MANIPDIPTMPEKLAELDRSKLEPIARDLMVHVQDLRNWCSMMYMSMKSSETRLADIILIGEQAIKMKADADKNYVALSNQVAQLKEDNDMLVEVLTEAGLIPQTEGE